MQIQKNIPLGPYSTMQLGGTAAFLCEIISETDLLEALQYAKDNNLSALVIGTGSNCIFGNAGYKGLVIVNKIPGIKIAKNEIGSVLEVGAGENWDGLVKKSVELGFLDIAALSLIPGTCGAAPVQNIGAYSQQVSDSIISIRAYDRELEEFVTLENKDCKFSYRSSRFNTAEKGRFVITSIKMQLCRKNISPPFYTDVENFFTENMIDQSGITPEILRQAVSTVRVKKLPDPRTIANCGSFFKNPVVSPDVYSDLKSRFPDLHAHTTDDGNLKLYGAQLIELSGLKDYHDQDTGMATWKNQALVLVNESAKTADDLKMFKEKIISAVQEKFGIVLVQEPEFIELV